MPDLTPEERAALDEEMRVGGWLMDADEAMDVVHAALLAVPRLREVEGMGFADGAQRWEVRGPHGDCLVAANKAHAVRLADDLNRTNGTGHHAVRLAVVEVATPAEEKDDGLRKGT